MIRETWITKQVARPIITRLFITMRVTRTFQIVLASSMIVSLCACQTPGVSVSEPGNVPQQTSSTPSPSGTPPSAAKGGTVPRDAGGSRYKDGSQLAGYRIGPEDVLTISVWKEAELQREVLVRPDGGISFPLAGNLAVAGKTTQEVELEITRKIRRYIPDAVVTVSVKTISGYTIYVNGKVNSPGKFTLGRYVDVVQALTLAGGLSPFAKEGSILVQRRNQRGTIVVFPFNYKEIRKGKNLQQNIILQSGDVIVVP
jgi:polysaccharide export outer membrane protein